LSAEHALLRLDVDNVALDLLSCDESGGVVATAVDAEAGGEAFCCLLDAARVFLVVA